MEGPIDIINEAKLSNYDFVPSIYFYSNKIDLTKQRPFTEVYDFDKIDSRGQPHFKLDVLKKYVKFYTMIRHRGKGTDNFFRSDMVECTEEMYEALPDGKDLSQLKRRLCPDTKKLKDDLMVKGLYADENERISFSIEIDICNKTLDS